MAAGGVRGRGNRGPAAAWVDSMVGARQGPQAADAWAWLLCAVLKPIQTGQVDSNIFEFKFQTRSNLTNTKSTFPSSKNLK
jgi:hypothetical protein